MISNRWARGVAWPNTRPCQGRDRRFESGRARHVRTFSAKPNYVQCGS